MVFSRQISKLKKHSFKIFAVINQIGKIQFLLTGCIHHFFEHKLSQIDFVNYYFVHIQCLPNKNVVKFSFSFYCIFNSLPMILKMFGDN